MITFPSTRPKITLAIGPLKGISETQRAVAVPIMDAN
jgi:hypothetical protein